LLKVWHKILKSLKIQSSTWKLIKKTFLIDLFLKVCVICIKESDNSCKSAVCINVYIIIIFRILTPKMTGEIHIVRIWNYLEPDLDYTDEKAGLTLYLWHKLTSGFGRLKVISCKPSRIIFKRYNADFFFQETDECASNPCKNKGKCVDGINTYWCACKEGYTGQRCEGMCNAIWIKFKSLAISSFKYIESEKFCNLGLILIRFSVMYLLLREYYVF
jgi:hypothetical protein